MTVGTYEVLLAVRASVVATHTNNSIVGLTSLRFCDPVLKTIAVYLHRLNLIFLLDLTICRFLPLGFSRIPTLRSCTWVVAAEIWRNLGDRID